MHLPRLFFAVELARFCLICILIISPSLSVAATASVFGSATRIEAGQWKKVLSNHQQVSRYQVRVDHSSAFLTRYERRDGRNRGLEGEHFSTLIGSDGKLKGFAHISLDTLGKPLPSATRSEQIARNFLKQAAPDLLPHMQISSIREYRHPIRISRSGGEQFVQLGGMWVKARNSQDGSWFWVIIDAEQRPMIFERDVQWSNLRFRRTTEHWLSDAWLKSQ